MNIQTHRGGLIWSSTAIVLLAWGVFSLGATHPWGYLPLMAGMTMYGALSVLRRPEPQSLNRGLSTALVAVCATVFLQLVPLPPSVIETISPATLRGTTPAPGAPVGHAHVEGSTRNRPLSVDPDATALGLACTVAMGVFFVASVRTMGADGARRVAGGLLVLGTLVALVGIAEVSTPWVGMYRAAGLRLPPDSMPHGPFSSRNHYAAWMLMTLALTLSYLCAIAEHAGAHVRSKRPSAVRVAGVLFAAVLMTVALVQTRSRAGILLLLFAVLALGGLLIYRVKDPRPRLLVAASLLLMVLIGIASTGVQPVVGRFVVDSWSTAHGRLPIWRQTVAIARDFPVTGAGFNTYQRIVQSYPTADLDEPFEGAHNDYLQLAAEGGMLVGLPVLAAVGFFIAEAWQRLRESSGDRVVEWLRIGAVMGLALLAVQETVDFSLQIPGNAALVVVLAAIAIHRVPTDPQAQTADAYRPYEVTHVKRRHSHA